MATGNFAQIISVLVKGATYTACIDQRSSGISTNGCAKALAALFFLILIF
jgi:hypothetical protein